MGELQPFPIIYFSLFKVACPHCSVLQRGRNRNSLKTNDSAPLWFYPPLPETYKNNYSAPMNTQDEFKLFLKYTMIGVWSVLVDYVCLYILYSVMMMEAKISVAIAFFISALFNYITHKKHTFKNTKTHFKVAIKYTFLLLAMLLLTVYSVAWLSENMNIYWAKLLSTVLVFFISFLVNRYWTYA
ncbi:MAG: GtrA family protein [Methylococcales symbiont of Iophon sp. n. MRB-2018]|nr:MAG: GtrA family protein [Methylococcales symbiont of Iophon sp. n. MRB-2018]